MCSSDLDTAQMLCSWRYIGRDNRTMSEIRITPSILNADLSSLDSEIAKIAPVSDLLHLDIMDNKFVPNLTWDFEAAEKIIQKSPISVDAHLMIADPDIQAPRYAEIGCKSVTVHFEACQNASQVLRSIRNAGEIGRAHV